MKGQLQMFKRISALLIAIVLLGSIQACSMPDNIFSDETFSSDEQNYSKEMEDIYDFKFSLGEQEFELPMNYGVLSARGWKISDEAAESDVTADQKAYTADTLMEPYEYSDYMPVVSGDYVIGAKFYNNSKKAKAISDCVVVGIQLDSDNGQLPSFVLHKDDLSVGSGYDVVLNSCGKPSYVAKTLRSTGELAAINDVNLIDTEESTDSALFYKITDHSFIAFTIGDYNGASNMVVCINIENDFEAEKPYDYSKEIRYIPESIELYKGPSLLGKKFSDFAYKYEGNLYTLPIPVRKLIDDGWEFVRGYGERIPSGTTASGLVMRKGNQAVSLMVHNYDIKYALTAINCYAVSMEACLTGPNVNIMMSKGITLGSTETELVEAFGKDYAKSHPVEEETDATADKTANATKANNKQDAAVATDRYEIPDMETEGYYIDKTVGEEFTIYSYIMPDDVPTVTLPVSYTDIGDVGIDLLGSSRKHIDIYVTKDSHLIYKIYMQNCPEYIVDEAKIIEQQMEEAREKEKEEREKAESEKTQSQN